MLHTSNPRGISEMLHSLHFGDNGSSEPYRPIDDDRAPRGRNVPVIPAANRYPRSIARAELESALQPWNRARLGGNGSHYGPIS